MGGPTSALELGRCPLRDLERDVDVRPQRPVVAVILGRAHRDDHRAARRLQVLAHLEVRHLGHVEIERASAFSLRELRASRRCSYERRIARVTSASGGHGSPWNSISTAIGPSKPASRRIWSTRAKSTCPSPAPGSSSCPGRPILSLRWKWASYGAIFGQVVDGRVAAVELAVRGVVVDPDLLASDPLDQRQRDVARGHDVAVDLERDDDAGGRRRRRRAPRCSRGTQPRSRPPTSGRRSRCSRS